MAGQLKDLLMALFLGNGLDIEDAKLRLKIYYERLKNYSDIEQALIKMIDNWKPSFGQKIPSIAEIINETKPSINMTWDYFLKNCNNNFKFTKIPDDVLAMKKYLGVKACEDMTEHNEPFLRKAFDKAIEAKLVKIDKPLISQNEAIGILKRIEANK
jgi:hypothetical protein